MLFASIGIDLMRIMRGSRPLFCLASTAVVVVLLHIVQQISIGLPLATVAVAAGDVTDCTSGKRICFTNCGMRVLDDPIHECLQSCCSNYCSCCARKNSLCSCDYPC